MKLLLLQKRQQTGVFGMFVLVNPLATTLCFPMLVSQHGLTVRSLGLHAMGSNSCTCPRFAVMAQLARAPQGLPPCRYGDEFQEACIPIFSHHPVSPDLSPVGKFHFGHRCLGHGSVEIVENNLRSLWHGSQRHNYLYCM